MVKMVAGVGDLKSQIYTCLKEMISRIVLFFQAEQSHGSRAEQADKEYCYQYANTLSYPK